jgi:hypothetical protein
MKQRFTVSQNDTAYTLGEYMLMKADGKKSENTALPVAVMSEVAVTNIVSFVDDKLTIKQAPVKDKTIRAFPFRASASAFLTASVACAFLLSFVLIGAKSMANQTPVANDVVITESENSGVGFVEDLHR